MDHHPARVHLHAVHQHPAGQPAGRHVRVRVTQAGVWATRARAGDRGWRNWEQGREGHAWGTCGRATGDSLFKRGGASKETILKAQGVPISCVGNLFDTKDHLSVRRCWLYGDRTQFGSSPGSYSPWNSAVWILGL